MKRVKLYALLSAAALLVSALGFLLLCYLVWVELEDHYKVFVVTGSHGAYYSMVFSHPGVLACLAAVGGTGAAAIVADVRAIRREERGALVLLILVCLALVVFTLLFRLMLKAL